MWLWPIEYCSKQTAQRQAVSCAGQYEDESSTWMLLAMRYTLSAITLGVSLLSAQFTSADDGTIHFSGLVQDQSCDLSINGSGSGDGTVTLPNVLLSELDSPGVEAGKTPFTIALQDCTPGLMVRPFFESNNVYVATGALGNSTLPSAGGAENINVAITNDQGTRLDLNTNLVADNPFKEIDNNGEVSFVYKASYLAIGNVGVGKVTSALVYNMIYQ
tara:strand:- start:3564 stop:4214 length:651 start_codon:yes stop_codon:yes gene_type:complete